MEVIAIVLAVIVSVGYAAFLIRCMEGDVPWARDFTRAMLMNDRHRGQLELLREQAEARARKAAARGDDETNEEPVRLVA